MQVRIYLTGDKAMYFDIDKNMAEHIENTMKMNPDSGFIEFNDSTSNKKTVILKKHITAIGYDYD